MSQPNRPGSASGTDRRPLVASALLFVGAVAAMLSTGAAARRPRSYPRTCRPPTISGSPSRARRFDGIPRVWKGSTDRNSRACGSAARRCELHGDRRRNGSTPRRRRRRRGLHAARGRDGDECRWPGERAVGDDVVVTGPTVPVSTAEPIVSGSAVEGHRRSRPRPARPGRGTSIKYSYHVVHATPAEAFRTARTALRSPEPRPPATRSLATTSGGGSAPVHRVEQRRRGCGGVEPDRDGRTSRRRPGLP